MTGFFRGVACLWQGFDLAFRPGLRALSLIPILLSFVVYAGLIWFASGWVDALEHEVAQLVPEWLAFLSGMFVILAWMAVAAIFVFTFALLASLIASPFNGPLAEAAERVLSGQSPPSMSWGSVIKALPRTLVDEARKLIYALMWSIPLLLLFFVPLLNLAAPVLWFLWGAWLAALAFTDFALGNQGFVFREMRRLLRQRWTVAIGFGAAVALCLTVPVLNLIAVPAAVCGGTALWVKELKPLAAGVK